MADKYDVVIIGAGIAGLSTGLFLQKMGKTSLILEHGQQVGGNMSGVWRKGFYFDCGDQSTENVGVLFPLMEELGVSSQEEWTQVKFRWASKDFDVTFYDYDQMREDFKKYFPDSAAEMDKWFDFISSNCRAMKGLMGRPFIFAVDGWKKYRGMLSMMAQAVPLLPSGMEMMTKTANEKALEIFPHEPRLQFLFGEFGVNNMLLMMHLFFWYAFVNDYWYPKAGLQGFVNKMADIYQERGGEIKFKSTVDKLITDGKTVTEVETAQGERFQADFFVNTGNPKRLINEMLDNKYLWPYRDQQDITAAPVAPAVSSACLGIDMDDKELEKHMKEHHTFFWRSYKSAEGELYDPQVHLQGWSMINATSFHLPHLAPEGKSSLVVQAFTPYHWQNGWGTGTEDPFARTEKYKEIKNRVLEDIIKSTEYIIPGLSEKIVYKELATPRSMSRWTLNPEGSIMGWTYDLLKSHMAKKGVFKRHTQFRTPLKNLFQAGHYSMWPGGVVFSAMSGKIVAKGMYGGFWRQLLY